MRSPICRKFQICRPISFIIIGFYANEFMRRFLLHVLPAGFHRVRHYGLLGNAHRTDHLDRARALLNVVPDVDASQHADAPTGSGQPTFVCPRLWCADDRHRCHRARTADPCATINSMCTMSASIYRWRYQPSTLFETESIGFAFALRRDHIISCSMRRRKMLAFRPATGPVHDLEFQCRTRFTCGGSSATFQIPIAN